MKILVVSDVVTQSLLELERHSPPLDGLELIISCGDLPPEYLQTLQHRYVVPLVYVLGNHDLRYSVSPPVACQHIDRRFFTYRGLRIIGFSGSRWYNGGKNQYREKEMARHLSSMRFTLWRKGPPDIVVTHASPRGIHDGEDRCHKGFKSFITCIERYRPAYFLHGHIHRNFENDGERVTDLNTTRVVNCYGYYIFEIEPKKAS